MVKYSKYIFNNSYLYCNLSLMMYSRAYRDPSEEKTPKSVRVGVSYNQASGEFRFFVNGSSYGMSTLQFRFLILFFC